jgi:isoleucyl-tRNA synthetase
MQTIRTVVTLGRGLRKRHDLRVRQPLASVTVVTRSSEEQAAVESHSALIAEELNVQSVEVHADEASLVDLEAKANFKELGPRYGRDMKRIAAVIASLDHDTIAALLDGETLESDGFTLAGGDLVVTRSPREGTVVATEASISVALDTDISDDLAVEGVARELVNRVQGLRRQLDLDVTSRIDLVWSSSHAPIAAAFATHGAMISAEILAETINEGENDGKSFAIGDTSVVLSVLAEG